MKCPSAGRHLFLKETFRRRKDELKLKAIVSTMVKVATRRTIVAFLERYREQLEKAEISGMFMIELMSTFYNERQWVLDSGSPTHICNHMQGLKDVKRLTKSEVDIRVGKDTKVAALAVGVYLLKLAKGHVIDLDECYYVLSITKNIISTSKLEFIWF